MRLPSPLSPAAPAVPAYGWHWPDLCLAATLADRSSDTTPDATLLIRAATTVVEIARLRLRNISIARTAAVNDLRTAGHSHAAIAAATDLSKARIAQIAASHTPSTTRHGLTAEATASPYRVDLYT